MYVNHVLTDYHSILTQYPVPPSTDQVQPSTNRHCLILTQYHKVKTSAAIQYWPFTSKYQQALSSTDPVPLSTNQYLKEY